MNEWNTEIKSVTRDGNGRSPEVSAIRIRTRWIVVQVRTSERHLNRGRRDPVNQSRLACRGIAGGIGGDVSLAILHYVVHAFGVGVRCAILRDFRLMND